MAKKSNSTEQLAPQETPVIEEAKKIRYTSILFNGELTKYLRIYEAKFDVTPTQLLAGLLEEFKAKNPV